MSTNSAAWLMEAKCNPLVVAESPMPKPGPNEVVIKNKAIAINPVDWKIQTFGFMITEFPNILGSDVAGEVFDVGSEVKNFKRGDRVLAQCASRKGARLENFGFQLYTAVPAVTTSLIPSSSSFTDAVVLPLNLSTASAGLYQPGSLELPFPVTKPTDSGKVILVWGGSGSVGSSAIQLAVASGVTVIATASKHNHAYAKNLGAKEVFDYNSPSVAKDIVKAIKDSNKEFAGIYDCVSVPESLNHAFTVLKEVGGANKKLMTVLPPPKEIPAGVDLKMVSANSMFTNEKVAEAVWGSYIPEALADGTLKFLPEPLVVGKGLESVQAALDKSKAGVSAKKVVVEP